MQIILADNATFVDAEKEYYRGLIAIHKNKTAIAKASGKSRSTLHKKFKIWGWEKTWVETPPPTNTPPPAAPAAPPAANKASIDHLTPEVRAKVEAMKTKK